MPLQVIHAFGAIKKCVAQYNEANGKLDAKLVIAEEVHTVCTILLSKKSILRSSELGSVF